MTELAKALGELGIWVRLHYVYPYPHVDEVIPLMAEGKILPYLDIPFQHASPRILKAMKRPAHSEATLRRIQAWREICPELAIRSTFIVGFPGEEQSDFDELLAFLEEAQLDRVGCFTYSPVEGATANALSNPVPAEVKQARQAQLMALQETISAKKLRRRIGQRMTVLVDEVQDGAAIARSYADAPEIDGAVYISAAGQLRPGDFAEIVIAEADAHDLWGALTAADKSLSQRRV